MQQMFCSRALTDCGFKGRVSGLRTIPTRQSKCLLPCDHRARVGIEHEASSCENRGMSGYGTAACGCKTDVRMAFDARAWMKHQLRG